MWSESSKDHITVSNGRYKKDPLILASAGLALILATLNVKNDWVNDEIHEKNTITRKTNRNLLSKTRILEAYGHVFDTFFGLPGGLPLEVDKSVQPAQYVLRKISVAMKEEIIKKIGELIK